MKKLGCVKYTLWVQLHAVGTRCVLTTEEHPVETQPAHIDNTGSQRHQLQWVSKLARTIMSEMKKSLHGDYKRLGEDWLIDWGLTALSAQIGYIMPLISMLQFKKWNYWESWQCYVLGKHTINHYNKWLFNVVFVGETLRHERYHESKQNQTTQKNTQLNTTQ